jgi:N-acetylglucosamine-6-sulfatase
VAAVLSTPSCGPATVANRTGRFAKRVRGVRYVLLPFLLLLASCCFALAGCFPQAEETPREDNKEQPKPPNVVLILADDLALDDVNEDSLEHMPNLKALMEDGTTFENAFVTNSLCCPSRATILRGQYTHNHQILHNQPPLGGAERFRLSGGDGSTMATWVKEQGYRTAFFGKYMNGYAGTYVPPGWDEWRAVSGNFLSNDLNENGHIVSYDADRYHLDDILSQKAAEYAERSARPDPPFFTADRPFLMWLGTKAPHQPATPAPRHENAYPSVSLPRPPSFDEGDVSDKPAWIRDNPPLSAEQKAYMEELYRRRLQSMLAVDDMIGDLMGALGKGGKLDNTYIFFTSDNGFHLGQHRLGAGKWTAYEEDIRIPFVVSGPGVPEGKTLRHVVLTNDLAPTFADLAGVDIPSFVDGRSLKPLLDEEPTPPEDWRKRFLIEGVAERGVSTPLVDESEVTPILTGDPLPNGWRRSSAKNAEVSETWGRPWMKAVRTENYLYVEYKTGEHELYDLRKDPYELDNEYASAPPELKQQLEAQLDALRRCSAAECRAAEKN